MLLYVLHRKTSVFFSNIFFLSNFSVTALQKIFRIIRFFISVRVIFFLI